MAITLAAAGCVTPGHPARVVSTPSVDSAADCRLSDGETTAPVRLAVEGSIDPAHAPRPTTAAERVVFAHLYGTLVNVDCAGRLYGGLAQSWTRDSVGRTWHFVLRDDARFWDGTRVTAADVVASLAAAGVWSASLGAAGVVVPWEDVPAEEPVRFADPGLAVVRRVSGQAWPVGTGAVRPAPGGAAITDGLTLVDPVDSLPVLEILAGLHRDARDLLDDRVDVLITDEPAIAEYAESVHGYASAPLPWTSTYAWLSPAGAGSGSSTPDLLGGQLRDAVRVESRAARAPLWWRDLTACELPPPIRPADVQDLAARVVTEDRDEIAAGLAARLVVLARSTPRDSVGGRDSATYLPAPLDTVGRDVIAVPLIAGEFRQALSAGRDVGYVVELPHAVYAPCQAAAELRTRTPWLDFGSIVPLVDIRRRVLWLGGTPTMVVNWDGGIRLRRPVPDADRP